MSGMSLADRQQAFHRQYIAILNERDPQLRSEDLLRLAASCEAEGKTATAADLYVKILETAPEAKTEAIVKHRLEALRGHVSFGEGFERTMRSFVRQAVDPKLIAPMLAGSLAYQVGRTVALGAMEGTWLRSLFSAKAIASGIGFAVEVPTFVGLQRALVPSGNTLAHDLRAASLSLGALKLFSFAGRKAFLKLNGIEVHETVSSRFIHHSRALIPQASALLGLMTVHRMEEGLGWRPHSDTANLFADSLATLMSLQIGSRLGNRALGKGFSQFQLEMEMREQARISNEHAPWPFLGEGGLSPQMALAGLNVKSVESSEVGPPQMMMSADGGIRSPYRGTYTSRPLEVVKGEARVLLNVIEDPKAPTERRVEALKEAVLCFAALEGQAEFAQGIKVLGKVIRQPKFEWDGRLKTPKRALAFYDVFHSLRQSAAESYVELLKPFPLGHAEVEAGIAIFRNSLSTPEIPEIYKMKGDSWAKLYELAEDHSRSQMLPLYRELLPRLATESTEVREGMRLLASDAWKNYIFGGRNQEGQEHGQNAGFNGRLQEETSVASAFLLSASSPFQRIMNKGQVEVLQGYLPYLVKPAERGDAVAISALAAVSRLGGDFSKDWFHLSVNASHTLKQDLRNALEIAEKVNDDRQQELIARNDAVSSKKRGSVLGFVYDVLDMLNIFHR